MVDDCLLPQSCFCKFAQDKSKDKGRSRVTEQIEEITDNSEYQHDLEIEDASSQGKGSDNSEKGDRSSKQRIRKLQNSGKLSRDESTYNKQQK